MSKHSYYRRQGYSTGEMLSEGKLDIWELPERVPLRFREKEEKEEEFEPSSEQIEAWQNAQWEREQEEEREQAKLYPKKPQNFSQSWEF